MKINEMPYRKLRPLAKALIDAGVYDDEMEYVPFNDLDHVDHDYSHDINDEAIVAICPGYWADDGDGDLELPQAGSGKEAAREFVDKGSWGEVNSTIWINVRTWREGYALDSEGCLVRLEIDDASHKISLDPDEPECRGGQDHDWQDPHEVVGGIKENPGVWGHGGGVIMKDVCGQCGKYRITDTWAQDRETGEQGLTSVRYEEADAKSAAWAENNRLTVLVSIL